MGQRMGKSRKKHFVAYRMREYFCKWAIHEIINKRQKKNGHENDKNKKATAIAFSRLDTHTAEKGGNGLDVLCQCRWLVVFWL